MNAELAVFAGDIIEILEKNADAAPNWQERAEDLLVLAKECAMMSAQQFRKSCEAIVHELDEKRQELAMGTLKQLHTRMLFILTRCTRLLQYQKRNFLELDILKLQKIEKLWQSVDSPKTPMNVKSDPVKIRKPASPPRFRPTESIPINRRAKDDSTPTKPHMATIKESESKLDLSTFKDTDTKDGSMDQAISIVVDRLASWKKFPAPEKECAPKRQATFERDESQMGPASKQRFTDTTLPSGHVRPQPPTKRHQRVLSTEDKPIVICRICEEEVPFVHLEEHSRVCAFADRCDHKGLGIDERLRRLAETLEHLVESYTPTSSQMAPSRTPDTAKASNGGDHGILMTSCKSCLIPILFSHVFTRIQKARHKTPIG